MNMEERYSRHLILPGLGKDAQEKLAKASVLLIGVGGLGSPISLYLTAAGVGQIGLVDDDRVSISNLQRQVLYKEKQVGMYKVLCAKQTLLELNSTVKINVYPVRLNKDNAVELIREYDVVVDGSDNFETRYLINDVCVGLDKPYVYGSIGDYYGQLSVFNYNGGATYRCLYPELESDISSPKKISGVLGVLPGIIGSMEASEVIKLITGCGEILSNKLFYIDVQNMFSQVLHIMPNSKERDIARQRFLQMV